MLRLISKIYSLIIIIQIVSIELNDITLNDPFRCSVLFLLTIPVIYHLIQDLVVKNKPDQNKAFKTYSFAYVCFYVLWCLANIIYLALNMGHISGYMAYILYLTGMLFLAPVLYIFAKNIFHKNKTPRYILIAYIVLILILFPMPGELNERGFYDTILR